MSKKKYSPIIKKIILTTLKYICIAAFWIALWMLIADHVGEELLLPSPSAVFLRLWELLGTSLFWKTTYTSLVRIVIGIAFSLVIGAVLGIITARIKFLDALFAPLLTVIKATPVASFIILAIIWIGRDTLPTYIAGLMVVPVIWGNMREGMNTVDKQLCEVAKIYDFSLFKRIKLLYLPHLVPYFASGTKTSIGLAWKAGVAAEVLTLPAVSIGKNLADAKTYLETVELFAWTLTVIILSLLLELLALKLIPMLYSYAKRKIRGKAVAM